MRPRQKDEGVRFMLLVTATLRCISYNANLTLLGDKITVDLPVFDLEVACALLLSGEAVLLQQ